VLHHTILPLDRLYIRDPSRALVLVENGLRGPPFYETSTRLPDGQAEVDDYLSDNPICQTGGIEVLSYSVEAVSPDIFLTRPGHAPGLHATSAPPTLVHERTRGPDASGTGNPHRLVHSPPLQNISTER
jgi:hypothetical protein